MKSFLLAAVAALLFATSAAAQSVVDPFSQCDGYKAPRKNDDGVGEGVSLFEQHPSSGSVSQAWLALGTTGISACKQALADPRLLPVSWARRMLLLRAQAAHQIAAGLFPDALASLDQSDTASAPNHDPFFAKSFGLANRALRAFAEYSMGNAEAGERDLTTIRRARPYAESIARLVRIIRLSFRNDLEDQRALLMADAPQSPALIEELFWTAVLYSDFERASQLGPQVGFDLPRGRDSWMIKGFDDRRYDGIEERADVAGATAYALIATGKPDAAAAAMAKARADVVEATAPPRVSRDVRTSIDDDDYKHRQTHGPVATARLDRWDALIALRSRAATINLADFPKTIPPAELANTRVKMDILAQAKTPTPVERSELAALQKQNCEILDRARRQVHGLTLRGLIQLMPQSEWIGVRPRFKKNTEFDAFMFGDNGFYITAEANSPYVSVRFGDDSQNPLMVEELAMLASAKQARAAGKDAFLLDSRMLIRRTRSVAYVRNAPVYDTGWEARLRILPVASAAPLPPDLEAARWRLIKADDVIQALSPQYTDPPKR